MESLLSSFHQVYADDAGKAYWVSELQQNRTNPHYIGSFILAVMNAAGSIPEGEPDYDLSQKDLQVLYNKMTVSAYYADAYISHGATWTLSNKGFALSVISAVTEDILTIYNAKSIIDYIFYGSSVILQTGQTIKYVDYDDGWYKKGGLRIYERDYGTDIVSEIATGLMWQDDLEAETVTKTWSDAIAYCENKTLGGYSDWRLPNINELLSIVDYGQIVPAMDSVFQNVISSYYWSSTTITDGTSYAWGVSFYYGGDVNDYETYFHYVRCVR